MILREEFDALAERVVVLERELRVLRPEPRLRVVREGERLGENRDRSINAILGGASEKQRAQGAMTHREIGQQLRDWADVLGYALMLTFAAAQADKQVVYAAYAMGELWIVIEKRAKS